MVTARQLRVLNEMRERSREAKRAILERELTWAVEPTSHLIAGVMLSNAALMTTLREEGVWPHVG